jgi:hydroxyacylglutathione hydrolase
MPLTVRQFPCLSDNYGFLARDEATGKTACIDTPEADAILRELDALGWRLDLIMNTHWHPDHAGGNGAIKAKTGAMIVGPPEVERISPVDRKVGHGDVVELGETLFALGCGRLFEGTAEQMWASLSRLAALPGDTAVYCAHEYTASNARFALSIDQDPALRARAEEVFAARARGEPTVPTTIAREIATNPFLKAGSAQRFGEVRAAKDTFRG